MTLADDSGSPGWYVVDTKPRQEQTARQNLLRQRFEIWRLLMGNWTRKRTDEGADWVYHTETMFPRYLFQRTTKQKRSSPSVRSTLGAVGLVRFGGRTPTASTTAGPT